MLSEKDQINTIIENADNIAHIPDPLNQVEQIEGNRSMLAPAQEGTSTSLNANISQGVATSGTGTNIFGEILQVCFNIFNILIFPLKAIFVIFICIGKAFASLGGL